MFVRVFRNLHTKNFSIQVKENGWRTFGHASIVLLENGRARVLAGGRERILLGGKKTIHAWIEGQLIVWCGKDRLPGLPPPVEDSYIREQARNIHEIIRYNPRQHKTFVNKDGIPVFEKQHWLLIAPGTVYAK